MCRIAKLSLRIPVSRSSMLRNYNGIAKASHSCYVGSKVMDTPLSIELNEIHHVIAAAYNLLVLPDGGLNTICITKYIIAGVMRYALGNTSKAGCFCSQFYLILKVFTRQHCLELTHLLLELLPGFSILSDRLIWFLVH
jgi:hypothetical protein